VIAELFKVAQSTPAPGKRLVSAVLPTCDLKAADTDAAAWCKTSNMILCEHPQEGALNDAQLIASRKRIAVAISNLNSWNELGAIQGIIHGPLRGQRDAGCRVAEGTPKYS